MLSDEELVQICRKYTIPCPVCGAENEYHRLKRDMAQAAKIEGDGHPLSYKWKAVGFDSVDPLKFFMGACSTCGFTGELDDADYRQAGKSPDLYRRDFGEPAIQAYKDGASTGKGAAQSLLKRLADSDELLKTLAELHLGILAQCSRSKLAAGPIARYYLRIAWSYRDREKFYPEADAEQIAASLRKCRKGFKRDIPAHDDYPAEPTVVSDEIEALQLSRTYFERNYELLKEAKAEDELRLRLLLAEIGFRLYELTSNEIDYKKASTFFSGTIQQCLSIISDKSIVGGAVNRAKEMLEKAGERGRELRALHNERGGDDGDDAATENGDSAPAKSAKGAAKPKKKAPKAEKTTSNGKDAKPKVKRAETKPAQQAPEDDRSVSERDKATRQISVLTEQVTDLKQRLEDLETDNTKWRQLIGRDALTGLPNRVALLSIQMPKIIKAFPDGGPFTCIAIGLDQVAKVNLEHGWMMGDRMLKASAKGLRKFCGEGEELYRMDGATFVLTGRMDGNAARQRISEMRRALGGSSVRVEETAMPMSSSLGAVTVEQKITSSDKDVMNAVYAALLRTLYRAKEKGGNTAEIHNITRF
ncbi:MAG: GGDEF domain-containing protein [Gemmatimonadetes bacterium]|mgnify:CR=1 FL=1|jgi:diguanylate cyclase (GGDEF)-like protein|nr:GGDEF domain-containing protein [Gemmatimonadota bacterium]MBT5059040.1 GGDEF domain-containing protein [Gemmatimonadota bacterium]MBT5141881.1 GGDEF domain-containing protein [Gemmatimonadota bacterium]MBT5589830.1 GGDEF domain-containing protein [Gemmatimonadota bacterium]MBT6628883.1 GGDEF domain-containing protein [Gemmatimonadota bacterium]